MSGSSKIFNSPMSIPKNGAFLSPYFMVDYNNTIDLNIPLISAAIGNGGNVTYQIIVNALGYVPVNPASAALQNAPTAPTATPGTNNTQIATTAFVANAVSGSVTGVTSFNTRTGPITLQNTDVNTALGYTPLSPNSDISTNTFVAIGASLARTTTARENDPGVNVKDWGATGNTQTASVAVTCTTSSNVITFARSLFTSADIGKAFQVVIATATGTIATGIISAQNGTTITSSTVPLQAITGTNAIVIWGTDDSAAFAAAMNYCASIAFAMNTVLRIPVGMYYLQATALPVFTSVSVSVEGQGEGSTIIVIDPNYPGNQLFAWSNCYNQGVGLAAITTIVPSGVQSVSAVNSLVTIGGFSIIGNRQSATTTHGIVFYDHCTYMKVHDITASCLPGSLIQIGQLYASGNTIGCLCESKMRSLRAFQCGTTTAPVMDFYSQGAGQSTNEITLYDIDVFFPYGNAWSFRNTCTTNPLMEIKGHGFRVEYTQPGFYGVHVGDPTLNGTSGQNVSNINMSGWEIITLLSGAYGFYIEAPTSFTTRQNMALMFQGIFINVHTGGIPIQVNNGDQIHFDFDQIGGPVNVTLSNAGTVLFTGLGIQYSSTTLTVTGTNAIAKVPNYASVLG